MRVLVQRVNRGSVSVDGQTVGAIDQGYVLFVGAGQGDTEAQADKLAEKVVNLRVFTDAEGKFNLSLIDVGGAALVISQFTLYADARKGRRPSFTDAARPDLAAPLVEYFAQRLTSLGVRQVQRGIFGAHMHVEIHNDGPVTIWLDSALM
ncbi:MAG: D-tyrosyl-tRNA(Tyr) deacylase [Phycisphaeraceae bacterium]|nr:D-tyrosyl-tRNA(Tyr) deacylase [Phycisphaeraceae bacterium]